MSQDDPHHTANQLQLQLLQEELMAQGLKHDSERNLLLAAPRAPENASAVDQPTVGVASVTAPLT